MSDCLDDMISAVVVDQYLSAFILAMNRLLCCVLSLSVCITYFPVRVSTQCQSTAWRLPKHNL